MGNKRIYLGSETSKYAKIAGGALLTITSLFFVLMAVGLEISGSNDYCLGTLNDPCVSYGKICNLGPDNYDIYNPDEVALDFSPTINNYWIFFKDGRVKKQMLHDLGINASTSGWRYENFTNATKPLSDRLYVHRFARYSCQDYMIVGLKNNPDDVIKWGVGVGKEYLDPFWYGVGDETANISTSNLIMELGSQVNITANLSGAATVCLDIFHPQYGANYTCGSPNANVLFNITYFQRNEFNDSEISKNISWVDGGNQTLYLRAHQYDEILSLSVNLSGFESNGTLPTALRIYINDTLSQFVGTLGSGELTSDEFTEGVTEKNISITTSGFNSTSMYLPKLINVLNSSMDVQGVQLFNNPGLSYNISGLAETNPSAIYYNGSNWFVLDGTTKNVTILDASMENVIARKSVSPAGYTPYKFYWNGANWAVLYAVGGLISGTVSLFDANWAYTGSTYDVKSYDGYGYDSISWNGTHWFMIGRNSSQPILHEFTTSFAFVNSYNLTINDTILGYHWDQISLAHSMTQDDNYIYIEQDPFFHFGSCTAGNSTSFIYVFNQDYTYTGRKYPSRPQPWVSSPMNCNTAGHFNIDNFFYVLVQDTDTIHKYEISYPLDSFIEVGTPDGTREFYHSGFLSGKENYNFTDEVNGYLDNCTADEYNYCNVPILIGMSSTGQYILNNLSLIYTYDTNPLFLDETLIADFVENSEGFVDVPIKFETTANGTLTVSDIKFDYAGGNDTIEILVYEEGDYTNNETMNVTAYYSKWDYAFPSYIDWLEFIPSTPTKKNVTPYGQTSSKPILNITNYGYGGMESNFSVYINESYPCVNLTMSTTNNKSDGFLMNSSWDELFNNFDYLESQGLWMWADYECNYTTWKLWEPDISFRNCCEDCICSEDLS